MNKHTRKPLELTVYPRLKRPRYGSQIEAYRQQFFAERKLCEAKRLTDAELAAEVWHFDYEDFDRELRADPDELSDEQWNDYIERRMEAEQALKRFALLPHYDEAAR